MSPFSDTNERAKPETHFRRSGPSVAFLGRVCKRRSQAATAIFRQGRNALNSIQGNPRQPLQRKRSARRLSTLRAVTYVSEQACAQRREGGNLWRVRALADWLRLDCGIHQACWISAIPASVFCSRPEAASPWRPPRWRCSRP
jgi:hypothetical protein